MSTYRRLSETYNANIYSGASVGIIQANWTVTSGIPHNFLAFCRWQNLADELIMTKTYSYVFIRLPDWKQAASYPKIVINMIILRQLRRFYFRVVKGTQKSDCSKSKWDIYLHVHIFCLLSTDYQTGQFLKDPIANKINQSFHISSNVIRSYCWMLTTLTN